MLASCRILSAGSAAGCCVEGRKRIGPSAPPTRFRDGRHTRAKGVAAIRERIGRDSTPGSLMDAVGPTTMRAVRRSRPLTAAVAVAFALVLHGGAFAGRADDTGIAPVPGQAREVALGRGEVRSHPIALQAGQLVEVAVREKGPRLTIVLRGPDGTAIAERTVPWTRFTSIRMLAVAALSGTHVLEV